MLLTRVLQVLLLPAVALLHSNEYGPRHLSELSIGEVAPYIDLSESLGYHRSHSLDYNARHVLGSVPPGLALAGYWRVTLHDGRDSGGGAVMLWTSGRGAYTAQYATWPLNWYVIGGRVLVLEYETLPITEFYSLGPPPPDVALGILLLVRGTVRLRGLWPNFPGN